jgi:hypothetical protein
LTSPFGETEDTVNESKRVILEKRGGKSLTPSGACGDRKGSGMTSLLKIAMLVFLLVAFVCIGISHVINPGWFIKRSGVQRGGKLLTEWNRSQFQIAGAIFAAIAAYLLYILFHGKISN